jgi:hypothetical protein
MDRDCRRGFYGREMMPGGIVEENRRQFRYSQHFIMKSVPLGMGWFLYD